MENAGLSLDQCSVTGYKQCSLTKYKYHDECILHCSKEDAMCDYHRAWEDLTLFKEKLLEYIVDIICNHKEETEQFNRTLVLEYMRGAVDNEFFEEQIKSTTVVFNFVSFPVYDERDEWDYTPILQRLGRVHFNYCKFYVAWIDLPQQKVFFQDCEFYDHWNLQDYEMLDNVDEVIYQNCLFTDGVSCSSNDKAVELPYSQFRDCELQEIECQNVVFQKPLFNNSRQFRGEIERAVFDSCIHDEELILKHLSIEYFQIDNCVFKSKFEIEKVSAQEMKIINNSFHGLVECFNCTFVDFYVYKTTFDDFVSFEFSSFGLFDKGDVLCTKFEYVTFLSFVNFRSTNFHGGLSLCRANFKEYPNFLFTDISSDNTDVETFRIIKHSFDKIGNTTEANRYFALEMHKQKEETGLFSQPEKKIILFLNYMFSNYGQSYMLPLLWIFMTTILYTLTIDFTNKFQIIDIFPTYHAQIESIVSGLNSVAKNIIPYQKFLKSGMEFVSLLFLILYSIFIYHFVVAVKRNTKR